MSRYIDADKLTEELQNMVDGLGKSFPLIDRNSLCMIERGIQIARQYIVNLAPAADVEEVRYGRWTFDAHGYIICPICGCKPYSNSRSIDFNNIWKHCPNC